MKKKEAIDNVEVDFILTNWIASASYHIGRGGTFALRSPVVPPS